MRVLELQFGAIPFTIHSPRHALESNCCETSGSDEPDSRLVEFAAFDTKPLEAANEVVANSHPAATQKMCARQRELCC